MKFARKKIARTVSYFVKAVTTSSVLNAHFAQIALNFFARTAGFLAIFV